MPRRASAQATATDGRSRSGAARVEVGPNVLVSRDGNTPHVELLVAFGVSGTAYFVNPWGSHLLVHRTEDAGATWGTPVELGRGYDHPQIAWRQDALFVASLDDGRQLAHGSLTSPVTLRLRVRDPMQVPGLIFVVSAAVPNDTRR